MRILLSNDDGYQAPGLVTLARVLAEIAEVMVVAPDRDRSGASNSLTLTNPLRIAAMENGFIRVDGTPTDCVHLAITGLLEAEPDIVVSGVNAGPNMGDDVIYSGTVAAAMEGRFLGLPAIAVSLAGHGPPRHFDTAAYYARVLVERLQTDPLPSDSMLNVNVPNLPRGQIHGIEVTRLGARHKAEPVVKTTDPRGLECYWVGTAGPEADAGPGTDFYAVRQGRVSVTPIHVDLTRHAALPGVADWLKGIEG